MSLDTEEVEQLTAEVGRLQARLDAAEGRLAAKVRKVPASQVINAQQARIEDLQLRLSAAEEERDRAIQACAALRFGEEGK